MAGVIASPQLEDYQKAAAKWHKELLHLTYYSLKEALKHMTVVLDVRHEENFGQSSLGAEFAPYKSNMGKDKNLNLVFRTLRTYFGGCVIKFDPNSSVSMIIGEGQAKMGDALKSVNIAHEVLRNMAADLGESLYNNLWTAKRNPDGETTADLFDGFQTIIDAEVTAGKIATSKGNYLVLEEEITAVNAYDVLKGAIRKANSKLRQKQNLIAFMPDRIKDAYEDSYLATHQAVPYNTKFNQPKIEGTNATIECGSYLEDSKYIVLSVKDNMLVGMDQMSDQETINVAKYESFILTFEATCFMGTQFRTIDPRMLFVIKLAGGEESGSGSGSASGSASE